MSNTAGTTSYGHDLERYRVTAEFRDECTIQWDTDHKSGTRTSRTWESAKPLGRGTFGHVRQEKRQDVRGDWHYRAVKVCALDRLRGARVDYTRELSALAALSTSRHCGLFVTLTAWWMSNANLYIAMEYIGNGDLSNYVDSSLTEEDAKEITRDILRGLAVLHRKGITHRDIKPQNILVVQRRPESARWWVKIGDFGISKRIMEDSGSELRTTLGTRRYCAPEILGYLSNYETSVYDSKVDMWSLGCILFNMGSHGRMPFSEADLVRYCDGTLQFSRLEDSILFTAHAKDLAKGLLLPDPKHRPDASDALRYPWLTLRLKKSVRETSKSAAREPSRSPKEILNQNRIDDSSVDSKTYPPAASDRNRNHDPSKDSMADAPAASGRNRNYNSFLYSEALPQAAFNKKSSAAPEPRLQTQLTVIPEPQMQIQSPAFTRAAYDNRFLPEAGSDAKPPPPVWATADTITSSASDVLPKRRHVRPILNWERGVILKGHEAPVNSVAWSPKGDLVASGAGHGGFSRGSGGPDNNVRLWNVRFGSEHRTLSGHTKAVRGLAFSPDGRMLASASNDGTVKLWAAPEGELVRTMNGHRGEVVAIAWTLSGQMIASGSETTVQLWNASTGDLLGALNEPGAIVRCLSFSPDSNFLASGHLRGGVKIWEVAKIRGATKIAGRQMASHTFAVNSLAISSDSRRCVSGDEDGKTKLWDVDSGRELFSFRHVGSVSALALSPNNQLLAIAFYGDISFWDGVTGDLLGFPGTRAWAISALAFSPDGTLLVSGSTDDTVQLWDLKSHGVAIKYLKPA